MTQLEQAAITYVEAAVHSNAAQHFGVNKTTQGILAWRVDMAFEQLKEAAEGAKSPLRTASTSEMLGRAVRTQGQCIEELALMLVSVSKTLPESEAKPLRDQLERVLERAKLATDEALVEVEK